MDSRPLNRPPTPSPKFRLPSLKTPQQEYVYVNSSNGYLDREVTLLKERVHQLESEIRLMKIMIEKQKN